MIIETLPKGYRENIITFSRCDARWPNIFLNSCKYSRESPNYFYHLWYNSQSRGSICGRTMARGNAWDFEQTLNWAGRERLLHFSPSVDSSRLCVKNFVLCIRIDDRKLEPIWYNTHRETVRLCFRHTNLNIRIYSSLSPLYLPLMPMSFLMHK